jgi:hypothetical protein
VFSSYGGSRDTWDRARRDPEPSVGGKAMKREGINYPKFKDQFTLMDFEAEPMPALSLFPIPEARGLGEWEITLTGVAGERRSIGGRETQKLPRVREKSHLVCQIFN